MTMTIEEKVGQMLVVGFEGLTPPDYILEWLESGLIGGVVLFARNIASPQQTADLTAACRAAARRPIVVAVDQEGGIVARLRAAEGFSESPGAMALGAADSETLAEEVAAALGAEMHAVGINWNLAPVADLSGDSRNPSIGTRALGIDPPRVAALVAAQVRGFQRYVAATAKHFPGLGHTRVDTHDDLAVSADPLSTIRARNLTPFRAALAAGTAAVMMTHVRFEAVDAQYPATLSVQLVQGLLREELGYSGLTCTDCMEMKAITRYYGAGESAVLAALAGQDVLFFSHTREVQQAAYEALLWAARSGRLPEVHLDEAVRRILALKARFPSAGGDLSHVGHSDHLALMARAARAGTAVVRDESGLLPLRPGDGRRLVLVEFASYMDTPALESGGQTQFATIFSRQVPDVLTVSLQSYEPDAAVWERALGIVSEADGLILATRSAHLNPAQFEMAQVLVKAARKTLLLCLRNPFDMMALPGAQTVICTNGDSMPALEAAVDALLGRFKPEGRVPVPLEQVEI